MANHKSTKKSIRQDAVRYERNKARKHRIKTFIKRVEKAIFEGNPEVAKKDLQKAESEIMKGVTKGIWKLKTASRKISRLSLKVKLSAQK